MEGKSISLSRENMPLRLKFSITPLEVRVVLDPGASRGVAAPRPEFDLSDVWDVNAHSRDAATNELSCGSCLLDSCIIHLTHLAELSVRIPLL